MTVSNNNGNTTITEKGICWGTSPNPTTSNTKLITNAAINSPISIYPYPLQSSTLYYIRAYAVTPLGTVYSSQVSTTTKELGVTTLTYVSTSATHINFSTTATNPPQLPITPGPTTTGDPSLVALNFTSIAVPNASAATYINTTGTTILLGTKQVELAGRQPNAPYIFTAIATYKQGNTGHDLVITSSPVNYTMPTLTRGQSYGGGVIFDLLQYGTSGYNGTSVVKILHPSDYPNQVQQSSATNAGQNPPNNYGYTDWRRPTTAELQTIFTYRPFLGSAGSGLSYKSYWGSNWDTVYFGSGTALSNTSTDYYILAQHHMRSVRGSSNNSL